jgi:hypothetical protein
MCLGQFRGYSHQDPRSQCPTRYPTIIFNVIILFIAANTKLLYFSDIYHSIVTTILRWIGATIIADLSLASLMLYPVNLVDIKRTYSN